VRAHAGSLHLSVRDDGLGGAVAGTGSGLIGLIDRVEARWVGRSRSPATRDRAPRSWPTFRSRAGNRSAGASVQVAGMPPAAGPAILGRWCAA
jgi:hypothetical protein